MKDQLQTLKNSIISKIDELKLTKLVSIVETENGIYFGIPTEVSKNTRMPESVRWFELSLHFKESVKNGWLSLAADGLLISNSEGFCNLSALANIDKTTLLQSFRVNEQLNESVWRKINTWAWYLENFK